MLSTWPTLRERIVTLRLTPPCHLHGTTLDRATTSAAQIFRGYDFKASLTALRVSVSVLLQLAVKDLFIVINGNLQIPVRVPFVSTWVVRFSVVLTLSSC